MAAMFGWLSDGEQVRLAPEAPEALGVLRHLGRQHLDRDVALEVRVGGAVDLAHPAGAEGRGDPVVRQRLADQVRHLFLLARSQSDVLRGVSSSIIPGRHA